MTKYSETQRQAINRYRQNKVDSIQITAPKGERDKIKRAASSAGQSLSQYILQAVHERMERDRSGSTGADDQ